MKTEETKRLEKAIWKATNNQGTFGCFEVTIGWFGKERVDYMTYDTKGTFRCYEIKVTKADFHSPCHNSFVGHLNYYVLPPELYEEVKAEIPDHVGVYIERGGFAYSVKKAKRRPVENADKLKDYMIRSLCREVTKQIRSGECSVLFAPGLGCVISRLPCLFFPFLRMVAKRLSAGVYGVKYRLFARFGLGLFHDMFHTRHHCLSKFRQTHFGLSL